MRPQTTEMKNVVIETVRTVSDKERGPVKARVRPRAGRKVLKMALEAMGEGHTVALRTHYDEDGSELLDVDITWDGGLL